MNRMEKIKQYWFVIKQLVEREIKRKYARSVLGIVWSVLNPLLSMSVMTMIFSTLFKRHIENYPIYYLTGTLFWTLYASITNSSMTSLVDNRNLMMKVRFPRTIFPVSRALTALVNFSFSLIAFAIIMIFLNVKVNIYFMFYPLYAALLFFFALGIGYILSCLYVLVNYF